MSTFRSAVTFVQGSRINRKQWQIELSRCRKESETRKGTCWTVDISLLVQLRIKQSQTAINQKSQQAGKQTIYPKIQVFHSTWNLPRLHTAPAVENEFFTSRNRRRMLVCVFRVTFDSRIISTLKSDCLNSFFLFGVADKFSDATHTLP
jgi:hypothetical protein